MRARRFVDTNVLLYAGSKSPADRAKRDLARRLLEADDIGFSVQVLQEFYAVAAAKQRLGITHAEAVATLRALLAYPVAPLTGELVLAAAELRQRFQISYWDAAIVAAAQSLGCEILCSEDLAHGQDYGGVVVQNPFAGA